MASERPMRTTTRGTLDPLGSMGSPSIRHLGAIDRPPQVIPRIRVPDASSNVGLTPLTYMIPRASTYAPTEAAYSVAPWSSGGTPWSSGAELPPAPPSPIFGYPQGPLPPGSMIASEQLIPANYDQAEKRALNENTALSFQMILFSLGRYPALITAFIAAAVLWGRGGQITTRVGYEEGAAVAGFATGIAVLISSLPFLISHHNHYKMAKILAIFRHIVVLVAAVGSVITIILTAVTIPKIQEIDSTSPSCAIRSACFTKAERTTYNAVLLGVSCMTLMLALFSLLMGCVGVYTMGPMLKKEKKRIDRHNRRELEETTQF